MRSGMVRVIPVGCLGLDDGGLSRLIQLMTTPG
jgi:hypothetical protein